MDDSFSNSASNEAPAMPLRLHPIIATGQGTRPREDSIDTGEDRLYHQASEDAETERLFGFPGRGTQGPAGSRVPDADEAPAPSSMGEAEEDRDAMDNEYMDDLGEAPPDSAGPVDPLEIHLGDYTADEGMEQAGEAAMRARRAGKEDLALLDEMEAAERAYEAQHAHKEGREQHGADARLLHKLQSLGPGQPGSPRSPRGHLAVAPAWRGAPSSPPGSPLGLPGSPAGDQNSYKNGGEVSAETRCRMVERIAASLRGNPAFAAVREEGDEGGPEEAARACEEALFASSQSRSVYLSKASNAVRVAHSVADVSDLPRIASGEPRGDPGAPDTTCYVTGLQGFVLKPEY